MPARPDMTGAPHQCCLDSGYLPVSAPSVYVHNGRIWRFHHLHVTRPSGLIELFSLRFSFRCFGGIFSKHILGALDSKDDESIGLRHGDTREAVVDDQAKFRS